MVNKVPAILFLYPTAVPLTDFRVDSAGGVETITFWNAAKLGAQPSDATLAAVTQAQADSAVNAAKDAVQLAAYDARSVLRASALVIADELNAHALKINAILTAVDNASTFANLKTAIAAIQDYPQRSDAQIRTAITNKLATLNGA